MAKTKHPTDKRDIEAGDKIKTEEKEIVVYSITSSTYFSKEGEHIHARETPKIVEKAHPIKEKNTIHDLEQGDLIQHKPIKWGSMLYRIDSIKRQTKRTEEHDKETKWVIYLNDSGHLSNICKDLTRRYSGRKTGEVTPIKPHEKQTLHDWAGERKSD